MKYALCAVLMSLVLVSVANGTYLKGYLDEKGDADYFPVYSDVDTLEVEFTFPDDASFWVSVIGKTGKHLGYFDLSEGEIIELYNGGWFTLVIISHDGDGKWTATY